MPVAVVSLNSCIDRVLECPGFAVGGHVRARLVAETPAGKAMNVARILGRLGVDAALYGFVGEDAAGSFAAAADEVGVRCRLRTAGARTRVNTTILDPVNRTDTHLREPGEEVPFGLLEELQATLTEELEPGTWTCFCGSLPPGVEPEDFRSLVAALAGEGLRVVVDTSGPALAAALAGGALFVKPNREELAALVGEAALEQGGMPGAARGLLRRYPGRGLTVLASDGERGAWLVCGETVLHGGCASPPRVVNTVGAGDALLAGYLWGVVAGAEPAECLRRSVRVAVASLACARAGELPAPLPEPPIDVVAPSSGV